MNNLPVHLSFSGIKEYCSDRQLFYKKYVLREWDENKWFNTLVGSGVHFVIEQFYKKQFPDQAKAIKQFVNEQYDLFLEGKVILNDDDINGRDKTDAEAFKEELELSIQRIIPVAMEYINSKMLFKMRGTEIGFKSQVGKALGFPHTRMQLKGIVDAITEDGVIIDWKTCSKFSPADKVEYMLQAINNALLFAETEGKLPKQVIFVEFLNTPSNADKVLEYEAKIAVWQEKKAAGEAVRKPSPPKLKENEERYREHVISLDKWKFQVYLELIDRITRELQGENLLAQGLPIPSVEAKYGKYEGWQEFCTKLLGYNPYTGEVKEDANEKQSYNTISSSMDPLPTSQNNVDPVIDTHYDQSLMMKATTFSEKELQAGRMTVEEAIDDLFDPSGGDLMPIRTGQEIHPESRTPEDSTLKYVPFDEIIEEKASKSVKNPEKDPFKGEINPEYGNSIEIPMTEEASLQKSQWQDKADEVTKEYNLISSTKTVRDEQGNWSVEKEEEIVIEDFDDVAALEKIQEKQKKKALKSPSTSLDSITPVEI